MADRTRRSLRRHLMVLVLAAVAVAWLAGALASYLDARHEVSELLDAHLAQVASIVSVQGGRGGSAVDTEHAPVLHRYGRRVMFQIWVDGTRLGLHSQNAPNSPLSSLTDGFSDVGIGGQRWRVFSVWSPQNRLLVQVAEQERDRDELTSAIALNFLLPLVLALPVLGLLVWIAIGRATRALRAMSAELTARHGDRLDPLTVQDPAREIDALVSSVNQLFGRVRQAIERERQFTADAAHELRTPLAAIRAQAQVALAATADLERTRALHGVVIGCDRATHAVEQMLTLARVSGEGAEFESARCDLRALARSTLADLVPAALSKGIDLELDEGGAAYGRGDAGLLAILLRNLVDNAIRYSPARTTVHVTVSATASTALVTITDAGPGIPREEREKVGRRFHRLTGTTAAGSGLGLSIANRIVEIHRGRLDLTTPPSGTGLRVAVSLPAYGAGESPRSVTAT